MAVDDKHKLLELLAKYSYQYRPEGLTLASGRVSKEYIDCKSTLSRPEALPPLGRLFLTHIDPRAVGVGGLTMGADPIAVAAAYASDASGRAIRWFSVRKEPKKHGLMKLIEGDLPRGANIVVVDDVVTTGGSTTDAIQKCRKEGLGVIQVLVLVDREEEDQGLRKIQDEAGQGVPVVAMFKKSEVRQEWESQQRALRATA